MEDKKSLRDMLRKKPTEDDLTPEQKERYDQLKDKALQYKGMNEDQLYNEMARLMKNKRLRDQVKRQDTDKLAEAIRPVLSEEQRQRLNQITQWLKEQ